MTAGAGGGDAGSADSPDMWEAKMNSAKLRERSEFGLADWRKYGFAGQRAADFEALRNAPDNPPGGILRIPQKEMTVERFWEYERAQTPIVVEGVPEAEGWPAWHKWAWQSLCERFRASHFKVGKDDDGDPIKVRLGHFASYLQHNQDDSPLYCFDSALGGSRDGTRQQLLDEYRVPQYFPDDYMALSGEDGRPPYRWILIGPQRSGTPVHIDPLHTSAWNASIRGRKRWMLMPPSTPRRVAKARDVMQKGDDDEAVNYFIDLLPRLRKEGHQAVEFVQYAGDMVFVPGNWWHCVVNLDDTVAVTQNFAGRNNFEKVWNSARKERPIWAHKWLAGMDRGMPSLAAWARRLNADAGFDMDARLQYNRVRRKRRECRRDWRALCNARKRHRRRETGRFDEEGWWEERRRRRAERTPDSSSSTVSTSSSETSSDSTTSSSSSRSSRSFSSSSARSPGNSPQRQPAAPVAPAPPAAGAAAAYSPAAPAAGIPSRTVPLIPPQSECEA